MIVRPVEVPRGSHPAAPGDRSAGLRRGILLLAVVLTVMTGPLSRTTSEQAPSGEILQPGTSFRAGTPR
jgi:hypothetical protein